MPAVLSSPKKPSVLVTGANGYIALWVIRRLLEQGYKVRAAVRSDAKGEQLVNAIRDHISGDNDVHWVLVQDIVREGAFDSAVKDVDAIVHIASPLNAAADSSPDEFIIPAVQGTLGILQSARKFGGNVKRIVITSSTAAVLSHLAPDSDQPTVTFNENNWGDDFVRIVSEQGNKSPELFKYRASKTLAEKAAWEFYERMKGELNWDLVVLNPSHVIWPSLLKLTTPDALNHSLERWFDLVFRDKTESELKVSYSYVDSRDTADAHIRALQTEEAGGQRIIISSGATTWQATRDLVRELIPALVEKGLLQPGYPSMKKHVHFKYDNSKSKEILGMQYERERKMISDMLEQFEKMGWFKEDANWKV